MRGMFPSPVLKRRTGGLRADLKNNIELLGGGVKTIRVDAALELGILFLGWQYTVTLCRSRGEFSGRVAKGLCLRYESANSFRHGYTSMEVSHF